MRWSEFVVCALINATSDLGQRIGVRPGAAVKLSPRALAQIGERMNMATVAASRNRGYFPHLN
jgi:hypothetical protein